jgi:hypothetical protein
MTTPTPPEPGGQRAVARKTVTDILVDLYEVAPYDYADRILSALADRGLLHEPHTGGAQDLRQVEELIARACADPGSVCARLSDETVAHWSGHAGAALLHAAGLLASDHSPEIGRLRLEVAGARSSELSAHEALSQGLADAGEAYALLDAHDIGGSDEPLSERVRLLIAERDDARVEVDHLRAELDRALSVVRAAQRLADHGPLGVLAMTLTGDAQAEWVVERDRRWAALHNALNAQAAHTGGETEQLREFEAACTLLWNEGGTRAVPMWRDQGGLPAAVDWLLRQRVLLTELLDKAERERDQLRDYVKIRRAVEAPPTGGSIVDLRRCKGFVWYNPRTGEKLILAPAEVSLIFGDVYVGPRTWQMPEIPEDVKRVRDNAGEEWVRADDAAAGHWEVDTDDSTRYGLSSEANLIHHDGPLTEVLPDDN